MLEGLYEIEWSRLTHPYGDASDIPDLIRGLASDDEGDRSDALEMLSYRICNESPVETMAAAVPFLIELAARPDVEAREDILDFLAGMAGGDAGGGVRADPNELLRPGGLDDQDRALRRARDLAWSRSARQIVESSLGTFLGLLADDNPKVRIGAAWVLARCRGRAALLFPEIEARVSAQADPRTRAALILALEGLAEPAGKSGSANALFEERMRAEEAPVVRLTAAFCLARSSLGKPSPEVIDVLCETAEAAWVDFEEGLGRGVAFSVSRALNGDPEARFRFLAGPLDSTDPYVRRAAQTATAQLGYDSRSITRAVAAALGERLLGAGLEDRRWITELLSGFGAAISEAIGPLADALADDDSKVRLDAALALANLRDPRALPVLIEQLSPPRSLDVSLPMAIDDRAGILALVRQMEADDAFPRITEAIGWFGGLARTAVPALVDLLLGSPSGTIHGRSRPTSIVWTLGRIGPDARPAIPALIALMREQPEAQLDAATAIGRIGGPEAQAAIPLLEGYLRSSDEELRVIAAEALWRIDRRADLVLPVLIKELRPGARSNSQAAEAIGEMGEAAREAIPALVACLGADDASDPDQWLQLKAAVALWRIEHRVNRALGVLIGLLEDPGPANPWMMTRVAEALGEIGAEARAAIPLLLRLDPGDDRSAGHQYLPRHGLIREDDAFLSAIEVALRRIQGDSRP